MNKISAMYTDSTDNITIYEVFGWTARVNWADPSHKISFGLFLSEEKAEAKITTIKSFRDWHMDWEDKFTVEERTAIA